MVPQALRAKLQETRAKYSVVAAAVMTPAAHQRPEALAACSQVAAAGVPGLVVLVDSAEDRAEAAPMQALAVTAALQRVAISQSMK